MQSMDASFVRRPIQRQQDAELDVEIVTVNEEAEQMLRAVLDDFESLLWFSYRKEFVPIGQVHNVKDTSYWSKLTNVFQGSGYTSDAGWGCMLRYEHTFYNIFFRTGQMMLAHAFMLQHLGRQWRLPIPLRSSYKSKKSKKVQHYVSLAAQQEVVMDKLSMSEVQTIQSSDGAIVVTGAPSGELPPQYLMVRVLIC